MTKKMKKTVTFMAAGMLSLANTPTLQAAPANSEIELLKQQVRELTQQNQQLNQRLTEMEAVVAKPKPVEEPGGTPTVEAAAPEKAKEEAGGLQINEVLSLSGSIEGDFILGEDFAGNSSSPIIGAYVASASFGLFPPERRSCARTMRCASPASRPM